MQASSNLSHKINSLKVPSKYSLCHMGSRRTQIATGQQVPPTLVTEKKGKTKYSKQIIASITAEDTDKAKVPEHRIDIGDEKSNLLGHEVFSGKLVLDKKTTSSDGKTGAEATNQDGVDGRLSTKALFWGSHVLKLADVISISYNTGMRHFTVHAYPLIKRSCGMSCVLKPQRAQKDLRFLASTPEEAIRWVTGFSEMHFFVNCLPHPMKQGTDEIFVDPFFEHYIKSKTTPKVLVILNPRSGHGRSSKVFHEKVEPIFKLAGFQMEVVKTTSAGHAKNLASTVDFRSCPDGIICVGGDGIVNEVLNGLLGRHDQKEAISIPIGVIPAGSDNSLVWTILGVRDPISAAITIVKGGLTPTDVFAVEWIQTGSIHFGSTVTYFGFISDVLELSEKYQKHFGPLRYFVAGFLKFLCLPKYTFELEYLPMSNEPSDSEGRVFSNAEKLDMSDLYTDIMRRSRKEGIPRANSLSSIDPIMTPSRMSGGDMETGSTLANSEPSEFVRCLDPKSKRLSMGRNNVPDEPEEVIHPQPHLTTTPNWTRTRSKSRTDKGWSGMTTSNDSRSSLGATISNDREDISSTISDPGPYWDSEPKWDVEPNITWEAVNTIELPGLPDGIESGPRKEVVPKIEEKWIVKKGPFLGILICNHSCKTVQSSQVVAPRSEHDDGNLDLILVHGSGRLRLARFFLRLQCGRHLSLPYVEYVKVKAVKVKPDKICHHGCGIDGELIPVNGQVVCSVLPEQCRLIGHPAGDH